ncbi:MAG: FHA domain-containing protein [Planctomycetes bacterium]|nr:FHA domain-containing protein [Planctomycetota bacterium]
MPATLRWNRLVIAAANEQEFIAAVFEYFPQLLQLPYDEVEMDITGSTEITEDAFRSIALKLIGGEAAEKKMLIRIPESVERYFKHANLFRVVDIDVVRAVPRNGRNADPGRVKANINAGKFAAKKTKGPAAPDKTERAPQQAAPVELQPQPATPPKRPTGKVPYTGPGWLVDVETGQRFPINDRITVGREAPADVVFQVPTISKRHFIIRRGESGFVVEDMRSTNGTYLNGLPVHEPMPLRDGDELVVAITLKHPKGARIFQFSTKPA